MENLILDNIKTMILKTFILAVLVIVIIHLTIRYLLQSNLLHKSKQIISKTILEEMFTNCKKDNSEEKAEDKSLVVDAIEEENEENEEDSEESNVDLKKMQRELMDYIIGNKEVFKEEDSDYPVLADDTSVQTDINYNLSQEKDSTDISKFFENKIDNNDYTLYTAKEDNTEEQSSLKKIEKGKDELGRWEYENENVINGGDIDDGLKGYDLSDSYYANIN